MYCQNCGKELKEGVNYCDQCGKSLHLQANNSPQNNLTLWQDIKKIFTRHRKGVAILFILIAVFLIVCSVIDLAQSGGSGSSGSWRGNGGGSATGPMDILFLAISIILIFLSTKLLKK